MDDLSSISIIHLKGVGPKLAERFLHLHILTVHDLLFHLPLRYEDRSRIHAISALKSGDRVLIEGTIDSLHFVGARRYLKCVLRDATGATIDFIFYHLAQMHHKRLVNARGVLRCFGEVRYGFSGHLEMTHPEYAFVNQLTADDILSLSPCLSPVYPTTKGISQITWRKVMRQALQLLQSEDSLPELLPAIFLTQFNSLGLNEALQMIHFPPIDVDPLELRIGKHPAQQRLIFEELVAHQLSLQKLRHSVRSNTAIGLPRANASSAQLLQQLPFQLTNAQQRVLAEIEKDLLQSTPMLRLVQGDVGSGKTIVACFAALHAIEAGCQVALMAPTEILCEQHFKNFSAWLSSLNIVVELLLGRQSAAEQQKIKSRLASGEIHFSDGSSWANSKRMDQTRCYRD